MDVKMDNVNTMAIVINSADSSDLPLQTIKKRIEDNAELQLEGVQVGSDVINLGTYITIIPLSRYCGGDTVETVKRVVMEALTDFTSRQLNEMYGAIGNGSNMVSYMMDLKQNLESRGVQQVRVLSLGTRPIIAEDRLEDDYS